MYDDELYQLNERARRLQAELEQVRAKITRINERRTNALRQHDKPGEEAGVSVRDVIEWWRLDMSLEEVLESYPQLRLAQVSDAVGYFENHRMEILSRIGAND